MMRFNTLTLLLTIILYSEASKLNVPRILLPLFRDFQTSFTLEVTDAGCYSWTPLRPNIVRVQCVDPDVELGCCSRVVVAAATKEFRRDTETVLAEDVHSGLVFRCEVILDVINSLTIVTTTREMLLDESPEAFEVRAYDDQGNEFSTLEGVELDWNLRTVGANNKSGESTVVRYMTFAESTYEAPKSIETIERQGLKGHIILLEGKQTGGASVTVRLPQPEYAHVPIAGVQLLVRTNLLIFPQEATVLKGDNLKYRLQQFQQGKVTDIKFPSAQYHLISEDSSVEVDADSGIATGLALGKVLIVLVDRNGVETDVKPPSAVLRVAVPHELSLAVMPSRKWSMAVGQHYDIVAELYDERRKHFVIGGNAVLEINIDVNYFRVDVRPRNGSFIRGVPLKVGRIKVHGELLGMRDPLGGVIKMNHLTAAADLEIYQPIHVSPSNVIIPWDPITRARYEIQFTPSGGDGTYTWSSIKSAVAVISQRGLAKTLERGSTTIIAAMTLNPNIRGTSVVHVVPPVALEILDSALEAEIGLPIPVYVVLYGEVDGKRVPFTNCDALPFEVELPDNNFQRTQSNASLRIEPSCATIFVTGVAPGATQITIRYSTFSASVVVAAYRPLTPLNPSSGTAILAVGTSRLIVFTGGPRSWSLKPSEHYHSLQNADLENEALDVSEQKRGPATAQKDSYPYLVSCRQLSETKLTLNVVNTVQGSNKPTTASASVTVICGKPKFLQLTPVVKNVTKCPLQSEEVVALSYKDLELEVTVKDAQGRRFDNITSLELIWSLTRDTLGKIVEPMKVLTVEEEGFIFPGSFIQVFATAGRTGIIEIKGKVIGYNPEVLFSQNLNAETPPFPERTSSGIYKTPVIQTSLSVRFVNDMEVSPNKTEIFAGDGEARELLVNQGSGHYEVTATSSGIVSVKKDGRVLQVKALEVGSVQLQVKDVCLDTDAVSVNVQVYRIGAVALDVLEYVERGKSVKAHVSLFDEVGDILTMLPNPTALKLTPLTGSDIIVVRDVDSTSAKNSYVFAVKGLVVGETTLAVSAGDVVSRSAPIHVFPPLRVSPRNVTLLVGSSIQVTTADGPPGAHLEFLIDDAQTAKVSVDGVVEGIHIGDCSLVARAIVIHRESGQKIIASQDKVDVGVVPLKGVTIHAPITTIVAGGKMPMWAVGPPGTVAVLRLGLSSSSTTFAWSVSQDSCAEIRTVFHDLGLFVNENDKVVMRFLAVKPGRVVVTLRVRVPGSVAGTTLPVEYSDSITIEIIPAISLQSPRPMTLERILISPHAVTELRLSREIRRFQVTSLVGGTDVVKVSQDGIISSGDKTGAAVIAFGPPEKPWRHLIVYVRPVEYVTVNVISRWRLRDAERLSGIPNGLDVDLSVSYHDEEGNEFDAVRSSILAKCDQKGLVNVARGTDNGTLILSMLDSGTTLTQVWDVRNKNQLVDYLPIRSSDVFFPPNLRISVGEVICLRMPVASTEDAAISWAVEDPSKLRLWPELGVAVACGQAGATVLYHQASPRLRSRIEIASIHRIDLLPHETMLTTAPDAVAEYPLVLSAAGDKDKKVNRVAFNSTCGAATPRDFNPLCYPFLCKLQFNNPIASVDIALFFNVAPSFNLETGLYSCRVQSIAKPSTASATLSEAIVLQAVTVDGTTASRASLIPFTPALFLHRNQIKVTHAKPTDMFTLSGIKEVLEQVKIVTDKHLVTVVLASQTETSQTYKVSVDTAWWTLEDPPAISVVVWSKLTNQKLQIGIRCGGLRVPSSEDSWFSMIQWISVLIIGIATVAGISLWSKKNLNGPVHTTEPSFLRTPTLEESLFSRSASSHLHSSDRSPVMRSYDDYPVYGSPWRRGTSPKRRE